jgi:hypothetical protein
MNREAAYRLLSSELAEYGQFGYDQLAVRVGSSASHLRLGADATEYVIEVSTDWRGNAGGDLVVRACASPANWGGPHDQLDDPIVLRKNRETLV